jgi:hypothetical protein
MRILMISQNDPAGMGIQLSRAISRHTHHTCRVVTTAENRYNHAFETDLHIPELDDERLQELEELLKTSDVFHFHILADEHLQLGPFTPNDFLPGKKIIHHHHGHPDFRGNPNKYRAKYQGLNRRNLLVSTPDLLRLLPEAVWQPNLVPIDEPLYRPLPPILDTPAVSSRTPILIGHSPTRKELKNTTDLMEVFESLRQALPHKKLGLDIIDNRPHVECLERKQRCQIVFDHMQGYYGVSSLEALSQGKPTIAGLDQWNLSQIKNFFGCDHVPWVVARNKEELHKTLGRLVGDDDWREETGRRSRTFMEQFWSDRRVAEALADFYNKLK